MEEKSISSGIKVAYSIKDVDIGGKGIFAKDKIYKGQLIWKYSSGTNVIEYDGEAAIAHLNTLTMTEAKLFLDLTYGINDKLCFIKDDGKYMNHSTTPNCLTNMLTGDTYALHDIEPDDQLFEDYNHFEHPSFLYPLLAKYNCTPDYYDIPLQ